MRDRLAYGLAAAAHVGVLVLALVAAGCAGVKPAPSIEPADAGTPPSKAVATKPPTAAPSREEVAAKPAARPAAPAEVAPVPVAPSAAKVDAPAAGVPPKAAVPVEPIARKEAAPPAAKPAPALAPKAAPAPKSPPPLDLPTLEKRLKETPAIGLLTKLTLKNQVDELLDRFRAHYEGRVNTTLAQLRQPYDLLILKVLSLLQDSDPSLARAVADSREAIWGILADRDKFNDL